MNYSEEVTTLLANQINVIYPETDLIKLRDVICKVLYDYEVTKAEKGLVVSDLEEKIFIYLQNLKIEGKSYETMKNYYYTLKAFSKIIIKPVNAIDLQDLRMYVAQFSNNHSKSTVNTLTSNLKSFFKWLAAEEYIAKNPAVRLKQIKLPKRLRKSLTADELERLRDVCKTTRERALLEFIFSTGCRVGEVNKVNISDIDISNNSLRIIGKGDKERFVYFSPKARLYLQKYLLERKGENESLFVTTRYPHARLGRRSIEKEISNIAKRAGFDKSVFPHLLRHTMATLGMKSGASIITIQHLLGHTVPATTQIYAELSTESIKHEYDQHFIQ